MFTPLLLLLLTISGSVVPDVESFEQLQSLPTQKYTKRQFAEIEKALSRKEEKIRLMSYNVLFNLFEEKRGEENRWERRFSRLVDLIEQVKPDILGVQELYEKQADDLLERLGTTYNFISRDVKAGETNGIFYRKDRFELIERTIWETPYKSEIQISDHLTHLILKDCKTGKSFAIINGHLAFGDPDVREAQAEFAGELASNQKCPAIFMGDLNTFPARPELYKMPFNDGDHLNRVLNRYHLKDAKELSLLGHVGPLATFTNEETDIEAFKGKGTPGVFCDHLYVSKGITVLIHAVECGQVDGHFPSDHMPVFADILVD